MNCDMMYNVHMLILAFLEAETILMEYTTKLYEILQTFRYHIKILM